jgi:hypothetical protein
LNLDFNLEEELHTGACLRHYGRSHQDCRGHTGSWVSVCNGQCQGERYLIIKDTGIGILIRTRSFFLASILFKTRITQRSPKTVQRRGKGITF